MVVQKQGLHTCISHSQLTFSPTCSMIENYGDGVYRAKNILWCRDVDFALVFFPHKHNNSFRRGKVYMYSRTVAARVFLFFFFYYLLFICTGQKNEEKVWKLLGCFPWLWTHKIFSMCYMSTCKPAYVHKETLVRDMKLQQTPNL